MARLFVAVWPPEEVGDVLAGLPRPDLPGVRWTAPERLHVTVRFLGDCDEGDAVAALSGLRLSRAEVVLGPAVQRLGRGVLAVPARGLDDLAAEVVAATRHIGQSPPARPFTGHVTVARYRGRPPAGYAPPVRAAFAATEIALVRSDPPGSYRNVAAFALL
ncbi:MAG: hypothetical protein OXG47_00540 [bacterium]|nr:hypothetical protein [bacterium]